MSEALHTERLRLEPLGSHHAEEYLAYYVRNREHLRRWEPARSDDCFTLDHVTREIAQMLRIESNRRFMIFELDASTIVGSINLGGIAYGVQQHAQLGYSIDVDHCGLGYATQAARAVVDYAFNGLRLHRVHASYQPDNKASAAVLRNLGFEVIGYARDHLFVNGAWRDGVLVAIINDDWTP
ncbi:MAG TPA: GNAT family protein [Candidatus Aquilonibacter sp.]|nr:GNAT family protein [Candidatus Aquilonibacter sp.]